MEDLRGDNDAIGPVPRAEPCRDCPLVSSLRRIMSASVAVPSELLMAHVAGRRLQQDSILHTLAILESRHILAETASVADIRVQYIAIKQFV
jgi:hypothetical protein